MSKTGRNDPCPSGAGVKFKKCLRQHPGLSPQSSAAAVWWVCDRWQADAPGVGELGEAWRHLTDPAPEKFDRYLELVFAEPPGSVNLARLFRDCHAKQHPDLPELHRRMSALLAGGKNPQLAELLNTAAEVFRNDRPEMYPEILEAILALDPGETEMESLEGIVTWAMSRGLADDCDRLQERFPNFPEFLLEDPEEDDEEPAAPVRVAEEKPPEFPPEVNRRLDEIWDEINAIDSPSPAEAESLAESLLVLPHEATSWSDVFDTLREARHPEIFRVFDRLVSTVTSRNDNGLAFMHWGAMEEAWKRNETGRLPHIARSFLRLDARTYDSDALDHVTDYLAAFGYLDECLGLMEHFFPIIRDDTELFSWVTLQAATRIFTLRIGKGIASGGWSGADADAILPELLADIRDEIDVGLVTKLVHRVVDDPDRVPSREDFQLPLPNYKASRRREAWITMQAALIDVARSAREPGRGHPGRTLLGLQMIERAAVTAIKAPHKKGRKHPVNLLDHLQSGQIENRVAIECRDIIGVNRAQAHVMLDAHSALARWAVRQDMMAETEASKIVETVGKLLKEVTPPADLP